MDGITTAFGEIAAFAREAVAVREAGFTTAALAYPRDAAGMAAICAFNNCPPTKAPRGWAYYPNAATKAAWERVIAALTAMKEDDRG